MSDVNVNENFQSSEAWIEAEKACYNYICNAVGYKDGLNAHIGDSIPDTQANLFAFNISGGPEQTQNFQCPRPNKRWIADAALIAQFIDRNEALRFAGRLQDNFPAYGDPEKRTGRTGQDAINIEPNVHVFELTLHPSLESRVVVLEDIGDKDKVVQFWILRCDFRCVYCNYFMGDGND